MSLPVGSKIKCPHPEHDDPVPSCHIYEDGPHCFGCGRGVIELTPYLPETLESSSPWDNLNTPTERRIVTTYVYEDENGNPVRRKIRYEPKSFSLEHWNGNGWTAGDSDLKIPYNLPSVRASSLVYIVEGEKAANKLIELGLTASCTGGANNWRTEFSKYFSGKTVIILPDNDDPGKNWAGAVLTDLSSVCTTVKIVNLPELEPKQDPWDWFQTHNIDDLLPLVDQPVKSDDELLSEWKDRVFHNLTRAHLDAELVRELHQTRPALLESLWIEIPIDAPRHGHRVGDARATVRLLQSAVQRLNPPPGGGGGGNNGGGNGGPRPNNTGLPEILWNTEDQLQVTEGQVRSAMDQYSQGVFYQAARGDYVKVINEDLQPLDDAGVKSMLSHMAHWRVLQGQRELGHPPTDAVKMVRSHSWGCDLPLIKRRVEVPFMLENGDIVSEPGFHEESGIYLLPRERIVVPDVPLTVSDEDVEEARQILEEALEGFNFKNRASRTNLLAMTLTSPLRELFKDNPMVPLLTSTAPQSGSGKGTSIRVPLSTAGIGPYSLGTTAYNSDENEFEKKLVAKLLKKSTYIFLDNIRSQVNSAVLEQMLTAANYDGRTLGHSEVNSLSTLVLWVCTLQSTGSFNRDLTRRCVPVELVKNWKGIWTHKNIDSYLADMRGKMIWACFVLARRWIDMGRPMSEVRLDGYTGWVETTGGILEHVFKREEESSLEFLENISSFRKTQDEISSTVDGILDRWLSLYGENPHPARMAVEEVDDPGLHQLLGLRGNPSSRQVVNALERLLTSQQGYIIGNTHSWECIGMAPYRHEGVKKQFRCVPLED